MPFLTIGCWVTILNPHFSKNGFASIHDYGGRAVIPPDKSAIVQKKSKIPALESRDLAIRRMGELGTEGRKLWKIDLNFGRASRSRRRAPDGHLKLPLG